MAKSSIAILALITLISLTSAFGQQQKTQEQPSAKASQPPAKDGEKKPAGIQTPTARLTFSQKRVHCAYTRQQHPL